MLLAQLLSLTRADALGSIFIRLFIWLAAIMIMAAGLENGKTAAQIKADTGWFFFFIFSLGLLSYAIFGFAPTF